MRRLGQLFAGILLIAGLVGGASVSAEMRLAPVQFQTACEIPESGPWPSCATGGTTAAANSDTCVIPPSGPWPPCATTGGGGATSGTAGCVIPPSGPWPPCATGGGVTQTTHPQVPAQPAPPLASTDRQRDFSLLETRTLLLSILNVDVANEAVSADSLLIPAVWADNSALSLAAGRVHLTSFHNDIRHELIMRLDARHGFVTVDVEFVDINSQRVSEAAKAAYESRLTSSLNTRLKALLNHEAVLTVSAENDFLRVGYTVKPTILTHEYGSDAARDLFLTILNSDMQRRFGNWQPDTVMTLQNRKLTLVSQYWDGTRTQRIELVARLGAANGTPLVGLEQLLFNGNSAAAWERTSAEIMLQQNLDKRIKAEIGNRTIVSVVAADNTLKVNYR